MATYQDIDHTFRDIDDRLGEVQKMVADHLKDLENRMGELSEMMEATNWTGPDDPDDPLNWPTWKRYYHLLPPAIISLSASLGSSICTPAIPQVIEHFGVSETVAFLPLTFYVFALGLGPVIAAPLSETYGRSMVYLISAPLGCLFAMGAGLSPTFAGLVILRFLAGLAFSPFLAVGSGTIADVTTIRERASASAMYILAPFLGPALGPVLGVFAATRQNFRWTQYVLVFFGAFSFLLILPMSETYKKTILERRAKRLGKPKLPTLYPTTSAKLKFLLTVTLFRPIHMLITEPIVGCFSLYVAFNFSVLFAFFASIPYTFESVYHFSAVSSELIFLGFGIGCILTLPTTALFNRYFYMPRYSSSPNNVVAPEYRLYPAMGGSIALPVSLFWFAWTARADVHWAVPALATILFAWGNLSVFLSSAMYLVDTYSALNGASAMAANGLLRYTLGAVFPLFTLQGFLALAMTPVPWVLFKYGRVIRSKSSYDTFKD